jgi:hypothetical protein
MTWVFDALVAHCSHHVYWMNGCADCTLARKYQEEQDEAYEYFEKEAITIGIHPLEILPGSPSPKLQLIRQQSIRKLYVFLVNSQTNVVKALQKKFKDFNKAEPDKRYMLATAMAGIIWSDLVDTISSDLLEAVEIGTFDGITQLELSDGAINESAKKLASDYAKARSAEMIGKKWVDDELVDNPNARYVISDTTRDDLQDLIGQAFDQKQTISQLEEAIYNSGIFTRTRAELIAKTELAMAQARGNLAIWKQSGIVKTVDIILSPNHDVEDLCDTTASNGPYHISKAPELPLHPRCECGLKVIELVSQ